jgi:ribokinase
VVVVGHVGRDVVLSVDEVPPPGGRHQRDGAWSYLEVMGYNQALGLGQLGHHCSVVAAVGDDAAGGWIVECARDDGIDPAGIAVRSGAKTSLVVSLVEGDGRWRYIEDLPAATFAQAADVEANRVLSETAAVTSLQMQEPTEATLQAALFAHGEGRLVVADGAPDPGGSAEQLLATVDVLRADQREAEMLAHTEICDVAAAIDAAIQLRSLGSDDRYVGGRRRGQRGCLAGRSGSYSLHATIRCRHRGRR